MRTPRDSSARRRSRARGFTLAAVPVLALAMACGTGPTAPQAASSAGAAPPSIAPPPGAACPPPAGPFTSGHARAFGAVTLPCLRSGPPVALDHLGGTRPVLVNLWASWCLPCQREMPRLQRVARLAGPRLLVLGVDTMDSTDSARSFLRAVGSTYPQVNDPRGTVRTAVHAVGLPATFALRADGSVAYRKLGELSTSDLATALHTLGLADTASQLQGKPA